MPIEYVDSNVWIALLQGEPLADDIRSYLREVRRVRNALITSILTLTEISIRSYKLAQPATADEHIMRLNRLAQVVQLNPDITKTGARLEAKYGIKDSGYGPKLTRWDALHLATSIVYRCSRFLTLDEDLLDIDFSTEPYVPHLVKPIPVQSGLRFEQPPAGLPPA